LHQSQVFFADLSGNVLISICRKTFYSWQPVTKLGRRKWSHGNIRALKPFKMDERRQLPHERKSKIMSIFNWFTRKPAPLPVSPPESSGLAHADATVPMSQSDRFRVKQAAGLPGHAANRKSERLLRRELLYTVVRDTMIRAGVLATGYKFKVLSLDAQGRQYLVMMDIANQFTGQVGRLAEIEAQMAQAAKTRHDILLTAVYWRGSEHVTAGLSPVPSEDEAFSSPQPVPQKTTPEPVASVSPPPATRKPGSAGYEPLLQDEVAAFKRALEGSMPATPLSASGQIVSSGRRNPTPQQVQFDDTKTFQDTQVTESEESNSPLGVTQYGELR
jgi:hypothetical protein